MRHQTITIAIPDGIQWRKGDHLGGTVRILVVDAEEPVRVPQRQTFDLSVSIDVDDKMESPTTADLLAALLRDWLLSINSPFTRPRQRDLQVVVHGEQTWTP